MSRDRSKIHEKIENMIEEDDDIDLNLLEEQNEQMVNEELLKLILYRSQRKWY